jgi:site-specific DNA-methyltransferase (adenine-specific)
MTSTSAKKPSWTELQLFNQDCVLGMKRLPSAQVDLVVTSPPYNLGIDYGDYDDKKTKEAYLEWTLGWATEAHRLLSNDGSLFLNIGGSPSSPLLPHEVLLKLSDLFVLQNTIHWIKAITVTTVEGKEISAGHFKPINSRRFLNDCHEYVFHLTKTGRTEIDRLGVGVSYADKSNIKRWAHTSGRDKRCRGNTWHIPYQTIQNRDTERPHPASFPKELPIMCIRLHGWRSDLVMMDPFLGIGNSALAAQHCGIGRFIGFELNKDYFREANRLTAASPLPKHAATTHRSVHNNEKCGLPSRTAQARHVDKLTASN